MAENKSSLENKLRVILIIFVSIFLILILVNISSAVIDCSMCHKTGPGKATIKAKDTIEITNKTCLKCHNPDYPPVPMGYNTHLAHVGKYSAKVDYFTRHPKAADSLSCDTCHTNIGQNCRNCHIKNIPHISPPLGYSCKGCHGELDKLFRHPTINLKIHNLFNTSSTKACTMCHNPDNMASLRLASGNIVPIQEPHKLCYQCHSNYYNLWNSGLHYPNRTIPSIEEIRDSLGDNAGIPGIVDQTRVYLEEKWRKENTCTNCHNPHNPSELYRLPVMGDKTVDIGIMTIISSNSLYVGIVLVVIVVIIIIFIIKKKKLKLSDLKLPKLKWPKISIPISISVEESEHVDSVDKIEERPEPIKESKIKEPELIKKIESVNKIDDYEKEIERPATVPKAANKNFLHRNRSNILFVLVICIIFGSFYVIFGTFAPMMVVVSESMSPHIEKGDLIFYTDISRIDEIRTYSNNKDYTSFENYGNVILYRPFGQEDVVPYIHRAIYYVNQGDEMWPGGSKAPYAGYITKGDNVVTNRQYDQQLYISKGSPVKKEWIIGVARLRVPYIGYIRMVLS